MHDSTEKKAEALRQLSCSWLISGLGCERPSRRKKNNPHCVPRHTGAGLGWSEKHLELFGEAHLWGTFLLPRQEEERGGTFTRKKKKRKGGTGSSPGLWHLNDDVQTQHAPS